MSTKRNSKKAPYRKPEAVKLLEELSYRKKQEKHPQIPLEWLVRTKYRDDNTNALTKCVMDWVTLAGGQAERINSTGRQIKKNGKYKWIYGSGTRGTSDISATIKGRSVKIEIKCKATGDRYQSEHQKRYQKEIEQAGGVYIIVQDFTGFYQWYLRFTNGE